MSCTSSFIPRLVWFRWLLHMWCIALCKFHTNWYLIFLISENLTHTIFYIMFFTRFSFTHLYIFLQLLLQGYAPGQEIFITSKNHSSRSRNCSRTRPITLGMSHAYQINQILISDQTYFICSLVFLFTCPLKMPKEME